MNKTKINASISAAGGIIVSDETEYWTSTQYDADRSWTFDGGVLRVLAKRGLRSSHPFCTYKYNPVPMVYISMIKIIIVTQKRNGHYLAKKYLMYVV